MLYSCTDMATVGVKWINLSPRPALVFYGWCWALNTALRPKTHSIALSGGRCRGSSATPFQFIFIVDCQPHPTPYRAFPVAFARVWNSPPDLVASAHSVTVFRSWLKTHLFNISYPCDCTVSAQWLYLHWTLSFLLTYLLTYSLSPGVKQVGCDIHVCVEVYQRETTNCSANDRPDESRR